MERKGRRVPKRIEEKLAIALEREMTVDGRIPTL
jgi:hypothetical protein